MSALVKKCTACRSDLPEVNGSGIQQVQCDKCKKNEEKYGPPTVCKYCNLPAAFRDQKCVYCSHSERKFGAPVACANCQQKCAFYKDKKKPTLCRACVTLARSNKQTTLAGVNVPPLDASGKVVSGTSSSKDKDKKRKKEASATEAPPLKVHKPMDSGEHILQLQQMKDKIGELQREIQKRDISIQEKDKKIAALNADLKSAERKQKEKFQQMLKERDVAVDAVHQKYREKLQEKSEKSKK